VYSDKDLDEYIERGLIGFEIKAGQGAKPGLDGEVKVNRELALKLKNKFFFPDDPEKVKKELYERHSVPGTFTKEILKDMIKLAKNNYPRVKLWLKLGPYADLDEIIGVASKAGIDCITIDGSEGGTGMSPIAAMRELGYPTLVCLKKITDAKSRGIKTSMIIAGRLFEGGHLVKSLCLGADGVAMGRPFIIASEGRFGPANKPVKKLGNQVDGVVNFVEAIKVEAQMLASALGKYSLEDLSKGNVGALEKVVADMFNIQYVYE
jgi:glutamate synthase domain-containing protein 2